MLMKQQSVNLSVRNFDSLAGGSLIRPKACAQILGVSIATFWRILKDQRLPVHKPSLRTTAIKASDLRRYINSRRCRADNTDSMSDLQGNLNEELL